MLNNVIQTKNDYLPKRNRVKIFSGSTMFFAKVKKSTTVSCIDIMNTSRNISLLSVYAKKNTILILKIFAQDMEETSRADLLRVRDESRLCHAGYPSCKGHRSLVR